MAIEVDEPRRVDLSPDPKLETKHTAEEAMALLDLANTMANTPGYCTSYVLQTGSTKSCHYKKIARCVRMGQTRAISQNYRSR